MLDKTKLLGNEICQGKKQKDHKSRSIHYGLFLAAKIKYVVINNEFGKIEEHETSKGFSDSKRLLDRSQYFKMIVGKKSSAMRPKN